MSDDENFMADRRGIKRAHESPKKVSSLFEGEALDAGSVESDFHEEWDEHFKNHPSQVESEDEATESDDNDKLESIGIETAIKNPNYWDMKDQDFKELAESFHAIYMDPDLRKLHQRQPLGFFAAELEDGLDAEPDSAEDDESEMRSQIFDVFAQIQDLNKTRFPAGGARAPVSCTLLARAGRWLVCVRAQALRAASDVRARTIVRKSS